MTSLLPESCPVPAEGQLYTATFPQSKTAFLIEQSKVKLGLNNHKTTASPSVV